jgi:hypothetical protein
MYCLFNECHLPTVSAFNEYWVVVKWLFLRIIFVPVLKLETISPNGRPLCKIEKEVPQNPFFFMS